MAGRRCLQEYQLTCYSNCADYGDRPSSSPSSAVISCGLSPSLRNYIPSSNPDAPICAKNTFTTETRNDGGNDNDEHDKKKLDESRETEARKTLMSGIRWAIMTREREEEGWERQFR